MTSLASRHLPALIAGRPMAADESFPVLDPATGQPIAAVARCGAAHVDAAVSAARNAFEDGWRRTPAATRATICRQVASEIRSARDELASLETQDTGKPISQALADVDVAARYFEYYGATVEALFGDTLPSGPDVFACTLVEPYGVCAHIVPWNYPLQVTARTVAPTIAAGNACVLKPAEDAPLSSLRLAQIALRAGLPAGILNVVPGYGAEAGAALASHPGIDHLSFTGSRQVGQSVMTAAAANIVPVTLELGGKSPHIVFPDADLDTTADCIHRSITEHAGQNCSAGSRLIVHDDIHDDLVGRLARRFREMRIGPGSTDPDLGPLISARQRERVLSYIDLGRSSGRIVAGGGIPADPDLADGFFVLPTLIDDVDPGAVIAQEEIFGPVLCVHRFASRGQALEIASNTTYGLAAAVWTGDVALAHAMCRELRAGQVFVNCYSAAGGVDLPFGGYRRSGIGREKGFDALREYTRAKAVVVSTAGGL
jgi:aldehyde dehydrogenase (NAD+)